MRIKRLLGILSIFAAIPCSYAQHREPGKRVETFTMAVPAPAPGGEDVIFHSKAIGKNEIAFMASEFSFDGAAVKNAPYSAEAVTETTQTLADGNRISHKNTAMLYRDSDGRTRREETMKALGPWASNAEPLRTVFINDPVSKTHMVLEVNSRTVRKMGSPEIKTFPAAAGAASGITVQADFVKNVTVRHSIAAEPAGAAHVGVAFGSGSFGPVNDENVKTESLGTRMIEGVRADGTRITHTIPAGAMGNERPIEIVSERWYSPELQTVVMTSRNDPRMGETKYRLGSISRGEPARSLFEAPADYSVADEPFLPDFKRMEEKILLDRKKD